METALEIYRQHLAGVPACDAEFFVQALARYRGGDDAAARDISGRCLSMALQLGEERARELGAVAILEVVQEANHGLWKAITTFSGKDFDEFQRYARECIEKRLAVFA
jgi:hypothetical protein